MSPLRVTAGALVALFLSLTPTAAQGAPTSTPEPAPTAPRATFHALGAPADPYYGPQWNLAPRTQSAGSANWQAAWESGATGAGVTVAVLDTGVTPGPDLTNVAPGWNFVANNANTADDSGHGTHVAGTVAQATNNGVGVAGVAGGATILPIKVLDADGDGSDLNIVKGINWAVSHGADVINLSLGGEHDGGTCAAVASAVAQGVVVVAASGNAGAGAVSFPAGCPGAVAVGATTIDGSVASYSNRGTQLAITAPGGNMTTDLNGDGLKDGILQWSVFNGNAGYYLEAGTSMASPHVAGAAALVKEAWAAATPTQVSQVLTQTATDRGAPGRDDAYGAGLLDIAAAVTRARQQSTTSPSSTTTPTTAPGSTTSTTTAPSGPTTPTDRLAGASRYGTAAAIGTAGWGGQTGGHVYLASGNGFADALATGALSGRRDGPLLLTDTCALPNETAQALSAQQPASVTIVGGGTAVCDGVENHVRQLVPGATVGRIAGADRYATSVELSRAGWSTGGTIVYLASGTSFADALGGAAQAAAADAPLLLTERDRLPDVTRAEIMRLGATEIRVLGGQSAVADTALAGLPGVSRIAGADRYATATAGVRQTWTTGADTVYLASGTTFPDGLAVGPLAAKTSSPLLLVPPCELPATVADALRDLGPSRLVVVGGASAVCDRVLAEMGAAAADR
jgi:cell wall-associated protease